MSTITTWFFKKRAFAFGIIAGGSSLGGVILPIMVRSLVEIHHWIVLTLLTD